MIIEVVNYLPGKAAVVLYDDPDDDPKPRSGPKCGSPPPFRSLALHG
jgi:hypothetical protein